MHTRRARLRYRRLTWRSLRPPAKVYSVHFCVLCRRRWRAGQLSRSSLSLSSTNVDRSESQTRFTTPRIAGCTDATNKIKLSTLRGTRLSLRRVTSCSCAEARGREHRRTSRPHRQGQNITSPRFLSTSSLRSTSPVVSSSISTARPSFRLSSISLMEDGGLSKAERPSCEDWHRPCMRPHA